jgi:hypothetical protein
MVSGTSPLLEREAELDACGAAIGEAAQGRGSLLLLEGSAGNRQVADARRGLGPGRGSLDLHRGGRRARGRGMLFVDDLDAVVAEIASRDIDPANRETYSNGMRKITYRDADGNEIGFGGPPLSAP